MSEVMIDAFAEEEPEAEAPAVETPPEATPEPEPETGETESAPPAETPQEPKAEPKDQEVPLAALLEERRKRKEAETWARQREEQLAQMAMPDPDEDPEGYARAVQSKSAHDAVSGRVELSREMMSEVYSDFEQIEDVFVGLVANKQGQITNPMLHQQMLESRNPARFAYETAKAHLEAEQFRDPGKRAALEAQMAERIRKEVIAELQEAGVTLKTQSAGALGVPDLISAAAAGNDSVAAEKPPTLMDVFDDLPDDE